MNSTIATISLAPTRRDLAHKWRVEMGAAGAREVGAPATGLTRHGAHCGCDTCITRARWSAIANAFVSATHGEKAAA